MTNTTIDDSLKLLNDHKFSTKGFIERWETVGRVYHDLNHIESFLNAVNGIADFYDLSEKDAVELHLNAWYHDMIYVPGSKENEMESAKLALQEIEDTTLGYRVFSSVLITKDHVNPRTFLEACTIDADLHGLGTEEYEANGLRVRAEYPDATEEQWKAGRTAFLNTYLTRPVLFYTAWGSGFEFPARFHMRKELNGLEK